MNVVRILIKYAFMKFCSLLLHCSSFSRLRDHFLHILVLTINNLKSLMECFTVCVYLKYEKLTTNVSERLPIVIQRCSIESFHHLLISACSRFSSFWNSDLRLVKIFRSIHLFFSPLQDRFMYKSPCRTEEYETLFKTQITSKFLVSLRIRFQRILSYAFLTTILFST